MKIINIDDIENPKSREGVAIGEIIAIRNIRGKFISGKVYNNCISIGSFSIECDTPEESLKYKPY